ncbi:MAG: outer membrane protein assembly factor BamA [Ignavibacteriae bacterium]|nr:outer membrane protein assembly factor BamA [Ignavibacteria bacterium]MBI3365420.1 outer membrane protein assembly factor BamA [Ignavibacteriota bacterium]
MYRAIFFVLLACTICHFPLYSQRGNVETYKILGISVDNTTDGSGTELSAIIANSGLKVGDEMTVPGDQIHRAILRLWALKIFSDVQILIEHKVDNGIYLLIRVKEYPRFDHLEIRGADDVGEDDIRKKVSFVKGQILTPEDINKAVKNVKRLYEDEGHLLAEVLPETASADPGKSNSVKLRLLIAEGAGVTLDKIKFDGNTAFSDDDLRGTFDDTKEKVWWQFWSHPRFDKKKFEADKQKLLKSYRKKGYLDAEILSDSTWYSADKKKISVLVTVHEGAQYKIRNIAWEGNTVYAANVLTERLGFRPGQVFDEETFEQNLHSNPDQNDVASLYLDNGYLKFNLDPDIHRVGEDSVDIAIHVYERNQFRIGQVEIKGNRKTYDNVIRRELFTRPGDYFDRSAIIRSLRQLSQLNYFNPEKLRPDTRLVDDQTVDLIYEVEEKSSDNVNASVGYSGAFGVTGALGFTINNFALSNPLSGGAGQVLNFDWQFGEGARFRTFSLGFTEPWLYNTPTTFGVSLFDTRQVFVYDLQQTGLSVRIGRGRLSWLDVYSRLDYNIRFQRNNVHNGGGLYLEGLTNQVSVTQTLSRNSTDSPIFPANGSIVSLTTEVSGGPILPGNVDYHKWHFDAEWFTPLFGSSRLVLSTSSSLGYIDGFNKDSHIPPIELYFMGGTGIGLISTTSLRGYEDRKIGPQDNAGNEIGGHVVEKHSLELRLALTLNPIPIYILGFAEGGNVFVDFHHTDFFDLKRSYGFGARLLIQPIGMVGFDYGYGVDDVYPRDGKPDGWKFHFQFGRGF